jgi:hypothetical protein
MRHPIILVLRLVLGLVVCVVLSCCPAKAQSQATISAASYSQPAMVAANLHRANYLAAAQPRVPLARALPSRPALTTAPTSRLPRESAPQRQAYAPPEYAPGHGHDAELVEQARTPFVTESRVAVVRLWGGHMELNGVESAMRMQNVQLGPPGFATLPPPQDQERLGSTRSYDGMSLVFNLGRDAHASTQSQAWHCLRLIKGRTNGCPL